jgi:hypothetical protein
VLSPFEFENLGKIEMKLKRYRFNRKYGRVYLEKKNGLVDVGDSLKVILLWASTPTWGKPFAHMPAQLWVQLCFLDQSGDWCYSVLNNGTTNALYPWTEYRKNIESAKLELFEVITTISLVSADLNHDCFDYSFSRIKGKPGMADRMRNAIAEKNYSLIDLDLDLDL